MKSRWITTEDYRPDSDRGCGRNPFFKGLALAAVMICLTAAGPLSAGAAGNPLQETAHFTPHVTEAMLEAGFWISRTPDPDRLLMTPEGIDRFNRSLAGQFDFINEIEHHPELSREQGRSLIEAYKLPYKKARFDCRALPVDDRTYDALREEMNLAALPEKVKPLWGVTVRRTSIRSFPTADCSLATAASQGFDLFQETEADIWTPLVILHRSRNGQWAFVRIYHYSGWMRIEDIAVAEAKDALFALLSRPEFLVATGSWVDSQISPEGSRVRFMMGTRIPLVPKENIPRDLFRHNPQGNFVVWVPGRNARGFFQPVMAYISSQADVHRGYLPYTRRNLLTQAFKMLGERYSWGGSVEGRDCSRLIVDVFRTVGILLPRNASQQAKVGVDRFKSPEGDQFSHLAPGAGLYMPGHAMLFIGNQDGRSYMIHCTAGFCNIPGEAVRPVMGVVVSDLSVLADGIRTIKAAREFLLPD